jgi:hypothetical protein
MRRAAWSLALLIAACSDKEPNEVVPPPPEPGLALADLCRELAAADCARLDTCDQFAGSFTRERCVVRQEARCSGWAAAVTKAVAELEVSYFELTAKKCRDRVLMLPCEAGLDHDIFAEADCQGLIAPLRNENETCSLAAACNDGLFCDGRSACPGTCKKLKTNNEMCSANEPCATGFFCAEPARRCHARVGLGQPCEVAVAGGNACVEGTYCDTSQPGDLTCAPVRGRGNGCTTQHQCVAGTRCINSTCSGGVERDSCESDADCNAGLRCPSNRCVKALELGEDCDQTKPCREGTACFSLCSTCTPANPRVCNARPVVGEDCDIVGERACYQARCVPGPTPMDSPTCQDPAADGAACGIASDCKPGRNCTSMICELSTPDCSSL